MSLLMEKRIFKLIEASIGAKLDVVAPDFGSDEKWTATPKATGITLEAVARH
jgi:hypothetical protein